jgi:mannosyltransferase
MSKMGNNPKPSSASGSLKHAFTHPKETLKTWKGSRVFSTVTLACILVFAAYVRFAGLGDESFWMDEGYTMAYTGLPFTKMIAYIATRDTHPPLYYILIKYWRILGDSEAFLRFPSAVFGIAAVGYMWSLVKEHWGTVSATAASLLLATSEIAIWFSQENRMYSLVLLLAVLSLRFFLRFVALFQSPAADRHGNPAPRAARRDCIGVTVFTLALLYTQSVTVFLWGTQLLTGGLLGLIPLIRFRRRRSCGNSGNPAFRNSAFRQWILCQAVIGVLYLPWLLVVFAQSANVHARFWATKSPSINEVWDLLGSILLWGHWSIPIVWDAIKLVMVLVAVRTVWNYRDVKSLALGASVVLPLLMSYLYSIYRTPILLDRALIYVCIPMLALIGTFLARSNAKGSVANKYTGILRVAAGIAIFAFLFNMNFIEWKVERGLQSKEDFRGAASNALKFADGATAVVFSNAATQAAFDYYFHRSGEGRNVDEYGVPCFYYEAPANSSGMEPLVTPQSVKALEKKLSAYKRVVFVRTEGHEWYSDPSGLVQEYFDSNWKFVQSVPVKYIVLLIYTRL